jgi:hypothetical protein
VSRRELAEPFTPTGDEMEWARERTQDLQHLLALVVWLKSYQRLGYFPKAGDVPFAVVHLDRLQHANLMVVTKHLHAQVRGPREVADGQDRGHEPRSNSQDLWMKIFRRLRAGRRRAVRRGLPASNVEPRGRGRGGVERRWSRRVLFGERSEKRGEPAEHVGQYEMVVVVT